METFHFMVIIKRGVTAECSLALLARNYSM